MKVNFMLIVTLAFFVACQKSTDNNVNQKTVASSAVKSKCNITSKFNANDTVGEFTGLIKQFDDTTANVQCGIITLLDGSGDSTDFYFLYSEVKNIDKGKMISGSCMTVKYYAEIYREGGEEIERKIFIKDIKYN